MTCIRLQGQIARLFILAADCHNTLTSQPDVSLTLIKWISWGGRLWKSFPCILRTGETNTSHEPTQNTPRGRKSWRKEEDHSLPSFVTPGSFFPQGTVVNGTQIRKSRGLSKNCSQTALRYFPDRGPTLFMISFRILTRHSPGCWTGHYYNNCTKPATAR